MNDGGFAAGVGPFNGWADILLMLDKFTVTAKTFSHFIQSHILAPMYAGLGRALAEDPFVDTHFKPPLIIHTNDADQWQIQASSGFEFRNVE